MKIIWKEKTLNAVFKKGKLMSKKLKYLAYNELFKLRFNGYYVTKKYLI